MNKILMILLCIFIPVFASAKDMETNRSDSLKQDANAILDNYEAVFSQSDINNATYKVTKTITVLNEHGDRYASLYIYNDKFRELKDFSGVIKNASGAVVKKIGKKDLTISSLSEGLAADGESIFYECKIRSYPYTIEYNYQVKYKNGIISYPPFIPVNGYMQSVQNARYSIEVPADMKIRYNSNYNFDIKNETVKDKTIYTFSTQGIKARNYEPLAPAMQDILPRVFIAPGDFCYDSFCGNMSTWNDYGSWVSGLLKDKEVLPADAISKIKDLTKDAKNDREKAEILYKYLQDNTRYVSIQLGIGGFQPMDAATVYKTKFGDCKGLSNLMRAFLKAVDIPSNYCEISMDDKSLMKDFSNVSQTDHVILLVPLENDSIWLECTSQSLPFGYIHDDIAGHDALVITDDGGKLCRLPSYPDQQNKLVSKLTIDLDEQGAVKGEMTFSEHLHGYASNVYNMTSNDREKVLKYINRNIKLPKMVIDNIKASEDKSSLPSSTLSANFSVSEYANKTGTRLFIPICPLNKGNFNIFSSNKRNLDIEIDSGFSESDSITINIPASCTFESLPKDIAVETPYGTFSANVINSGNQLIYIQNIDIFSGRYDKSKYEEIKAFFAVISSATKRKIVIKKT